MGARGVNVNVVCAGSTVEKGARQHGVKAVHTWWCAKVTVMVMVTVRRVGLWAQPVRNASLVALCESGRTLCHNWA